MGVKHYDVIVIGGGPGGYTAALYCARSGRSVAVLEKLSAGGQMATTDRIDNYPGFEEGIDGFELGERMERRPGGSACPRYTARCARWSWRAGPSGSRVPRAALRPRR